MKDLSRGFREGIAVVEAKPDPIWKELVVIKVEDPASSIHLDALRFPAVGSSSEQVEITNTIRHTGALYLESIRRTPLERPRVWII